MRYTQALLTGAKPVTPSKPKSRIRPTVPQTQRLNSRQVKNSAGGYVYNVDSWTMFDRFLILGAEGGTYYTSQQKLTLDNAKNVLGCIKADGKRAVLRILEVSARGLAPKQDAGIFALAMCHAFGDEETRRFASSQVENVCRTASTLFQYVEELKDMRSLSGRTVRRALQNWYQDKSVDDLAYQMVKYQNRNNWRHRDLLKIAHPAGKTEAQRDVLYQWAISGEWKSRQSKPQIIEGFEALKHANSVKVAAQVIRAYKIPWEAVPTEFRKSPEIWAAMLESGALPMTAMIRNLGNMTSCGYLNNTGDGTKEVIRRLEDGGLLKSARIHPMNVLIAGKTYAMGHGFKGGNQWSPVQSIVAALDDCFYESFQYARPTGKKFMLGIDVSGSMTWASSRTANGLLTSAEAAAAMAMYWVRTEETAVAMGFAGQMVDLKINRRDTLGEALRKTSSITGGPTDCSLPMQWALKHRENFDCFMVLTDNETWYGQMHPQEALRQYRDRINPDASQVVAAFVASNRSIADPNDPRSLDVVGFDASVPQIVAAFVAD